MTGSTGLLGHRTVDLALDSGHEVYSAYRTEKYPKGNSVNLNLRNFKEIRKVIENIEPEAIINAAAFTDVDGCEKNPEKACEINSEAPKILAKVSDDIGAHLIQVSTDYVFDGKKGNYIEDDPTNPRSVYGRSKLMGENNVKKNCSRWTIARTSVLYGWEFKDKLNFATWLVKKLSEGNEIQIVDDQYNSPTLNTNLAEVLLEAAERSIEGLYHVACSSRVNRYEFSKKLAEAFNLDKSLINRTRMENMGWKAPRPKDSSLDVSKSQEIFDTKILNCENSLEKMWSERKS